MAHKDIPVLVFGPVNCSFMWQSEFTDVIKESEKKIVMDYPWRF